MSDLGEKAEKTSSQTQELPPDILADFNLKPEDLEKIARERAEHLAQLKKDGANNFRNFKEGETIQHPEIRSFTFPNASAPDLADSSLNLLEQHKKSISAQEATETEEEVKSYIEGWGTGALWTDEWQVAVNTLDAVTPNGIRKNTDAMAKINEQTVNKRVEIARLTKEREESHPKSKREQVSTPEPTVEAPNIQTNWDSPPTPEPAFAPTPEPTAVAAPTSEPTPAPSPEPVAATTPDNNS